MVHRDIKPGNLMLTRQGNRAVIKVLDFGLAKVSREVPADGALTHEGQMLGTPDFIAPEQSVDARRADIRADIYSLGCTLYYLLSGGPPFKGTSLYDILQAHHSRDALPLNLVRPEVPEELASIVARMMAKEPERRFQTPAEVAKALTPFFKTGSAAFRSPKTDVSQTGLTSTAAPTAAMVSKPTRPVTSAGRVTVQAGKTAKPNTIESLWDSHVESRDDSEPRGERSVGETTRWPPWVWPAVATGVLMLALLAAWIGGVLKVKSSEGVIVLENVPKDAEVLVDGGKVTFTWPGAGEPVEIRAVTGQRRLEVKKDGFKTFGEVVTFKADKREEVTVRLEPLDAHPVPDRAPVPTPPADGDAPTVPTDGRSYRLVNLQSGKALAVAANGWSIVQVDVDDDQSQFWTMKRVKGSVRYRMFNVGYGKNLNISNSLNNRGTLIVFADQGDVPNAVWDFHGRGKAFRISSPFWFPNPFPLKADSGIALKSGSQAGQDVMMLPPTASDNELWKLIEKPAARG
jgi:hypothetical protein